MHFRIPGATVHDCLAMDAGGDLLADNATL